MSAHRFFYGHIEHITDKLHYFAQTKINRNTRGFVRCLVNDNRGITFTLEGAYLRTWPARVACKGRRVIKGRLFEGWGAYKKNPTNSSYNTVSY